MGGVGVPVAVGDELADGACCRGDFDGGVELVVEFDADDPRGAGEDRGCVIGEAVVEECVRTESALRSKCTDRSMASTQARLHTPSHRVSTLASYLVGDALGPNA